MMPCVVAPGAARCCGCSSLRGVRPFGLAGIQPLLHRKHGRAVAWDNTRDTLIVYRDVLAGFSVIWLVFALGLRPSRPQQVLAGLYLWFHRPSYLGRGGLKPFLGQTNDNDQGVDNSVEKGHHDPIGRNRHSCIEEVDARP